MKQNRKEQQSFGSDANLTTIECQHCGYTDQILQYRCMDISVHPEWKQELLQGEFFNWVCPQCGVYSELQYPCRYLDPERKVVVVLRPGLDFDDSQEVLEEMNENLGTLGCTGFLHRAAGNFFSMQEIVCIRDTVLSDKVINLIKPLIIGQLQSAGKEVWNGFFTGIGSPVPVDSQGRAEENVMYMSEEGDLNEAYKEKILWFDIHMTDRSIESCGVNMTAYRLCQSMLERSESSFDDGRYHLYDLTWAIDFHNQAYQ